MGEQSNATVSLRIGCHHTANRRWESVGGSRVLFAGDTWEEALSLSVSHIHLNTPPPHPPSLSLSHTHARTVREQ